MQFPTVATLFHRCYARGFRFKVASSRDERTTRDEWFLKPVEEWRVSVSDRRTMARAQGDRVPWKHSTRNCALTRFHVRPEILPFSVLPARRCFSKKISFLSFETTVIIGINYLNFRVFNPSLTSFSLLALPLYPQLRILLLQKDTCIPWKILYDSFDDNTSEVSFDSDSTHRKMFDR